MKTVVVIENKDELPSNFIEDKFGWTYFPKQGGEYRLTKDVDGNLRTGTSKDIQGLVFQSDVELEFPELDALVPGIKLEKYSGWTALWLSYVMIIGGVVADVSTQDIVDDVHMTLIDSVTLGILTTEDGEWYDVPMYDKIKIAVTTDDDGMPDSLLIKTTLLPDRTVTIPV